MRRLIVLVAVVTLLILGTLTAGFVITTSLNRNALLQNRARGDVTRTLVCEMVRHMRLPAGGCP